MKRTIQTVGCIVIMAALILIVIAGMNAPKPHSPRPPVIMIEGVFYMEDTKSLKELPTDSQYLGEIKSSVKTYESPKNEFEGNREGYVGSKVYRLTKEYYIRSYDEHVAEGSVLLLIEDRYWIFNPVEEEN